MARRRSQDAPIRKEDLRILWRKDGVPYVDGRQTRFWSVSQRLQALELLRRIVYGYDPETARIDRTVFEIVKTDFRN